MKQTGFILDLDRCTGCSACAIACRNENPVSSEVDWRTVFTGNARRAPGQAVLHYSLACNHCRRPACLLGCPARAYEKDRRTGAVVLNPSHCIGCGYCSWVCPYDAPKLNERGVMEKCTFCLHRLADELPPMCVAACPTGALGIDPDAAEGPIDRPGFPDTGLAPSISIVSSRRQTGPATTFDDSIVIREAPQPRLQWSAFASEWTLWLFTSVATLLVAWLADALLGGPELASIPFAAAGGVAMAVSALHLRRPERMWRALFGLRTSWISREVASFALFFAGACAWSLGAARDWLGWAVFGFGLLALLAMDMVYRIRGARVAAVPHSAMTTLTVPLYVAFLVSSPVVLWSVAVVKAVLYLIPGRPHGSAVWALLRLILLGAPIAAFFLLEMPTALLLGGLVLGELMDRAELYAGLCFVTPERQIADDFAI